MALRLAQQKNASLSVGHCYHTIAMRTPNARSSNFSQWLAVLLQREAQEMFCSTWTAKFRHPRRHMKLVCANFSDGHTFANNSTEKILQLSDQPMNQS
jgi:hypothetical protein